MRRTKKVAIQNFEELYHYAAGPQERLGQVLTGHLAIEFLLRQLILLYDQNLVSLSNELSFARLVSLVRDLGIVSDQRSNVLAEINRLINRYAHEISYEPEISDILPIFKAAKGAFTDYSDGLKNGIEEISSVESIYRLEYKYHLSELFLAVIYDLHQELVARGGDDEVPHTLT
ncbi:hypothetical protein CWE12_01045 [Aliidiomarina sedimenti]|uniref:DUF4145 domain-containing protein n=1 Tax=Aliidiomarina sedimenti TaxID=1933879 RepID=A0ABY0C2A0_9GAMM|nr:hypothetical protein [Aliidiomarina sedimenti]RUO31615.1 hypothetical protein CWE12_01045 [Aliidiomarina sedimenti]